MGPRIAGGTPHADASRAIFAGRRRVGRRRVEGGGGAAPDLANLELPLGVRMVAAGGRRRPVCDSSRARGLCAAPRGGAAARLGRHVARHARGAGLGRFAAAARRPLAGRARPRLEPLACAVLHRFALLVIEGGEGLLRLLLLRWGHAGGSHHRPLLRHHRLVHPSRHVRRQDGHPRDLACGVSPIRPAPHRTAQSDFGSLPFVAFVETMKQAPNNLRYSTRVHSILLR